MDIEERRKLVAATGCAGSITAEGWLAATKTSRHYERRAGGTAYTASCRVGLARHNNLQRDDVQGGESWQFYLPGRRWIHAEHDHYGGVSP